MIEVIARDALRGEISLLLTVDDLTSLIDDLQNARYAALKWLSDRDKRNNHNVQGWEV
jgi:hypothetical protein